MVDVILASQSKIRKEMMEESGIPFEVIVSNADETPDSNQSFDEQLKAISLNKAMTVFNATIDRKERIIVAADQNIMFNGIMYGKPKTIDEARFLIKGMMGSENVFACVGNAIIYANGDKIIKSINNCDVARMSMDVISDEKLEEYLSTQNPLSKCGGINISCTDFLHLEDGNLSTALGMTIEFLQDLLASF